ncbi:hypothetical protein WJX82_007049 [Trebouxia sp. C0006]
MFLISMVLVGQLVDNVDLPQERKEPVKTALLQLGFSASSATDKAFCKLASMSEYTVRVTGLGDRDEGVVSRMSVGFFTRRAQTCQQLTRMLQQNGLVMDA